MEKFKIEIPIYSSSQENAEAKVRFIQKLVKPIFIIIDIICTLKKVIKTNQ